MRYVTSWLATSFVNLIGFFKQWLVRTGLCLLTFLSCDRLPNGMIYHTLILDDDAMRA